MNLGIELKKMMPDPRCCSGDSDSHQFHFMRNVSVGSITWIEILNALLCDDVFLYETFLYANLLYN